MEDSEFNQLIGSVMDDDDGTLRTFDTGAARDTAEAEPWGFCLGSRGEVFSQYMHKHRLQPDGTLRATEAAGGRASTGCLQALIEQAHTGLAAALRES